MKLYSNVKPEYQLLVKKYFVSANMSHFLQYPKYDMDHLDFAVFGT